MRKFGKKTEGVYGEKKDLVGIRYYSVFSRVKL